jgi:phosphate acetyltransferase
MGSPVIERITARAVEAQKRVVLPEAQDLRVLHAARQIADRGYARVTLLGSSESAETAAAAEGFGLEGIEVLDPSEDPRRDHYVQGLLTKNRKRGMSLEQAAELLRNPVYFGGQMLADGRVDAMVAGSVHPTSDTIRAALWSVGTAPGCQTVSSCSLMQTQLPEVGVEGALVFADTGVVPEPTVDQLADIAIQAGEACRTLLEVEPRIAMISFSTKGSAASPSVEHVIQATRAAQSKRPDLLIDGELQVDAALVPSVASRKAAGSVVAGKANVLVFPNLSVGNVAYKLVERLGQALALGPLLLGLGKPVNDLSRGCSVNDIVLATAISAVQATGPRP